jgi:hypothetical protein
MFSRSFFAENPELRNRKYPLLLSTNDRANVEESPIPYEVPQEALHTVIFFRLDLPFGATTIEFSKSIDEADGQLERLSANGEMPQRLEAPLAAFDFTDGSLYKPLLLAVHWAAELIPASILEAALGEVSFESIMA